MAFEWTLSSVSMGSGAQGILMGPPLSALVTEAPFTWVLPPEVQVWRVLTQSLSIVLPSYLLYHLGLLSSLWCWASSLWAPLMEPSLEGWCEAAFCMDL